MKKILSINKICFNASFWPSFSIVMLSIILALFLFKHHASTIFEREINRHELISQLLSKAAASDIIIGNEHALYITFKDFKDKNNLDNIQLSETNPDFKINLMNFIKDQKVKSAWAVPGITPSQYIYFESSIEKNLIAMPFLTILGIIILFIFASTLMYQRIKHKLYQQIVRPINQTLNCNGENLEWFDTNSAASEIATLYKRTNDFIKTLHQQRDLIEENKVKRAKYDVALQVAHDIRSPVLALVTISKMFDNLTDETRFMISNVTNRINQIANDILRDYRPCEETSTLSVASILKNVVDEKRANLSNKDISLDLTVDDSSLQSYAEISESNLSRALSNLLNNAIESIGTRGSISVTLRINQGCFHLSITDTGCGISSENLKLIFEPGISINKHSTGLGLAYIKRLMQEINGEVKIESALGIGTTVTLVIPQKLPLTSA